MRDSLTDRNGNPWPTAHTIDGVLVVPGLRVWNYDLRSDVVTDQPPHIDAMAKRVAWFHTERGLFDGSRMWVRHPSTGETVPKPEDHEQADTPAALIAELQECTPDTCTHR